MQEKKYRPVIEGVRYSLRETITTPRRLVGDKDRDKVTDYVNLAYSEGFIDAADCDKRTTKALEARSADTLWRVLTDLPPSISTRVPEPPAYQPVQELIVEDEADWPFWALVTWIGLVINVIITVCGFLY